MNPQMIALQNGLNTTPARPKQTEQTGLHDGPAFRAVLGKMTFPATPLAEAPAPDHAAPPPDHSTAGPVRGTAPARVAAAAAYRKQEGPRFSLDTMSDLQKYKDDQLLSNPGGDHYDLDRGKVMSASKEQKSFWGRLKKDVSDAFSNIKNCFRNFLFGSKICYRDAGNRIREGRQRGLVGSVVDFFKDLGSAFTFGAWRPDGEEAPRGIVNRMGFFFSKMKEALFGDLVQGVSGSVIHMGEDLLFAGWNLLETIPDATIGNFEAGRKLTTQFFDNGQVVLDYLTDILPSGEAWLRVHSPELKTFKPPLVHNASTPERNTEDERWAYVRNTPFRKTIETIGSLIGDIFSLKILGQLSLFGQKRHHGD